MTKREEMSIKDETGAPGIVVGVSIDGKPVWQEGLGYADIENRVLCTEDTVMRIASISKSITMIAVAKLWEEGKLDLDKPVQEYVPYFPKKTYEGKKVDITCRHLVSHLSGIRHYEKNVKKEQEKLDSVSSKFLYYKFLKEDKDNKNKSIKESQEELEMKEYFIKDKYENVKSALDLFKDDPLIHKPGTKFLYTTHGWTLVSAMVEAVVKEPFDVYICKLFKELGLTKTYLDVNEPIIYHRSRSTLL
ncbi:serine beta-lactamase-like protein LACTB, mitochondrial isoform X5 [Centruroides sculpturatus]|uniref:serine beta-lactamase-like protein LACTB, mitochondrial isoform X5 n=1 Tax=Centruroides sculpturatus TaxID=218467 RepID=UPI000C6D6671|nr:serine beta-lactamase-like protein LACTB, mitochondrial isoform X5 [Centruroides sculpturatus]